MSFPYHKLIPIDDRVIVEPIAAPEKIGGIYVPDMVRDKPTSGRVVAVGLGRIAQSGARVPMTVKVGDEIVYNVYNAAKIVVENTELTVIHENEIAVIVQK